MADDLYTVLPDGTKSNAWIMEELLGDDDLDEGAYAHRLTGTLNLDVGPRGGCSHEEAGWRERCGDEGGTGKKSLTAEQEARKARARHVRAHALAGHPRAPYPHGTATHDAVRGRLKELVPNVFVSENKQTAITAASHVAEVLEALHRQGVTMPDSVMVEVGPKRGLYGSVTGRALYIQVPESLPADANLDDAAVIEFGGRAHAETKVRAPRVDEKGVRIVGGPTWLTKTSEQEYDRFSIRSMNDVVMHEMGHVRVRDVTAGAGPARVSWPKAQKRDAMRNVSLYAATNNDEFLAEAFVKLSRGETLPPDSQRLYEMMGGPTV